MKTDGKKTFMKTTWRQRIAGWVFTPEAVRLVPVVLPDRRLDESELRHALANAAGSPLWDAVMQVLLENYQGAQATVSTTALAGSDAKTEAVGGMSYLGQAIGELQDRANGARRHFADEALRAARKG